MVQYSKPEFFPTLPFTQYCFLKLCMDWDSYFVTLECDSELNCFLSLHDKRRISGFTYNRFSIEFSLHFILLKRKDVKAATIEM
jgi:hypothetical protein